MHCMSKVEAGNDTHKQGQFWILKFYYTFPYALLVVCIGQELFLLLLYVYFHLSHGSALAGLCESILKLSCPVFAFKQICNVFQLMEAADYYATIESEKR